MLKTYGMALGLLVATSSLAMAGGLSGGITETPQMAKSDWAGAYIGGFLGGGNYAGTTNDQGGDALDADGIVSRLDDLAGEAGVVLGYNVQRGSLVYGAEVDFAATGFSVSQNFDEDNRQDAETTSLLSLRGRVGVAVDDTLIFGTVGYGIADVSACASGDDPDLGCEPNGDDIVTFDDTLGGLVLGVGLEHRLTETLSVRLDYLHFESVWSDDINYSDTEPEETARFSADSSAVRFGVSYHF